MKRTDILVVLYKKSKKSAVAKEVARPKPVAAAAAAGSLKPKIDGDQKKKAQLADEAYDQIHHEIIHEAPDSPIELGLPPPP